MKRYLVNFTIERPSRDGGRRRVVRSTFTGLEVMAVDRKAVAEQVQLVVTQHYPGWKLAAYSVIGFKESS